MINVTEIIEIARAEEQARENEWEEKRHEQDFKYQYEKNKKWFIDNLLLCLRLARPKDYLEWLTGYLQMGGGISHGYLYNMPDRFYVATGNFSMKPLLYGAQAVSIIVPSDIEFNGGGLGHCELYFMKDFTTNGIVPLYNNVG